MYNYGKFMIKKEKKRIKNFSMGKNTAKRSLVILSALVIYTAPTVDFFRAYSMVTELGSLMINS